MYSMFAIGEQWEQYILIGGVLVALIGNAPNLAACLWQGMRGSKHPEQACSNYEFVLNNREVMTDQWQHACTSRARDAWGLPHSRYCPNKFWTTDRAPTGWAALLRWPLGTSFVP